MKFGKPIVFLVTSLLVNTVTLATTQPLNRPPVSGDGSTPLVFSAPPRETPAEGERIYGPIVAYLSQQIGKPIVYRHPQNWLSYQTEMLKGSFDIAFDGPHFNSWRISHQQHNALARLAEDHVFVVIVGRGETRLRTVKDLAGKPVCAMNPPNLGTLALQSQFDNPSRQPLIRTTIGWKNIYDGVVSGRCVAGVLPLANLHRYDPARTVAQEIYRTAVLPNQAFSAGPRVTREDQQRIAAALVAPTGHAALRNLLGVYASQKGLVPASKDEYAGVDRYLKDVWGFARK